MEGQQYYQGYTDPYGRPVIVEKRVSQKNGLGVAGFILALIGLFLSWIPILGWAIWLLGAVFSFIGLFKRPRGLAIAGFIISIVTIIILAVIAGLIQGALGDPLDILSDIVDLF